MKINFNNTFHCFSWHFFVLFVVLFTEMFRKCKYERLVCLVKILMSCKSMKRINVKSSCQNLKKNVSRVLLNDAEISHTNHNLLLLSIHLIDKKCKHARIIGTTSFSQICVVLVRRASCNYLIINSRYYFSKCDTSSHNNTFDLRTLWKSDVKFFGDKIFY